MWEQNCQHSMQGRTVVAVCSMFVSRPQKYRCPSNPCMLSDSKEQSAHYSTHRANRPQKHLEICKNCRKRYLLWRREPKLKCNHQEDMVQCKPFVFWVHVSIFMSRPKTIRKHVTDMLFVCENVLHGLAPKRSNCSPTTNGVTNGEVLELSPISMCRCSAQMQPKKITAINSWILVTIIFCHITCCEPVKRRRVIYEVFNIQTHQRQKKINSRFCCPSMGRTRRQSKTQKNMMSCLLHPAAGSSATAGPAA